jgi:hypothetical protein
MPLLALMTCVSLGCDSRLEPTTRPSLEAGRTAGAEPAGPRGPSQPGFYPLTVGNRWEYVQHSAYQLIPNAGPAPPPELMVQVVAREIVGAITIQEKEYLVELTGNEGFGSYAYFRQDATGLYEWLPFRSPTAAVSRGHDALEKLGLSARSPAERDAYRLAAVEMERRIARVHANLGRGAGTLSEPAPPGARTDEWTRLRYPLEFKSRWEVSSTAVFPLAVEVAGVDNLKLPPGTLRGYRLRRLTSVGLGPNDTVLMWYGTSGLLQIVAHVEFDAVDLAGNGVGRYLYDYREYVSSLRLVDPPTIAQVPPWVARPRK